MRAHSTIQKRISRPRSADAVSIFLTEFPSIETHEIEIWEINYGYDYRNAGYEDPRG